MRIENVKDATPEQIRELQLKQLEILKAFKALMDRHGLTFYLLGGTMIGAVRNHGFVPWDDDVDVIMPRKDYELLYSNRETWLKGTDYNLVRTDSVQNQHITGMSFKDTRTTFINQHSVHEQIQHSIGIDVNPLDFRPVGKFKRYEQMVLGAIFSLFNANRLPDHQGTLLRLLASVPLRILPEKIKVTIWMWAEKRMVSLGNLDSGEVVELGVGFSALKRLVRASWFDHPVLVDFEDTKMPVPNGYDEYLTAVVGNYMAYPPEATRVAKHRTYLIDTEKAYSNQQRMNIEQKVRHDG